MTKNSYLMEKKYEVVAEVATITGHLSLSPRDQDLVKLTYLTTLAALGLATPMRESDDNILSTIKEGTKQ